MLFLKLLNQVSRFCFKINLKHPRSLIIFLILSLYFVFNLSIAVPSFLFPLFQYRNSFIKRLVALFRLVCCLRWCSLLYLAFSLILKEVILEHKYRGIRFILLRMRYFDICFKIYLEEVIYLLLARMSGHFWVEVPIHGYWRRWLILCVHLCGIDLIFLINSLTELYQV